MSDRSYRFTHAITRLPAMSAVSGLRAVETGAPDIALIRKAILATAGGAREFGDRRAAIAEAVAGLREGDVLVVAGKGHEQGQIVGKTVYPFDDATEVANALKGETV